MKNIIWTISLFLIIGVSNVEPAGRIIGGTNAKLGQFPYQIELTAWHATPVLGGGSIISQNYVITAAHCTHDRTSHVYLSPTGLGISAGSIGQRKGIYIQSRKYTNPPGYIAGVFDHDICVITLSTPLAFSINLRAINLPAANFVLAYGSPTIVSGWGITSSGKTSSTLQYAQSPSINLKTCETWFPSVSAMADRVICAGHLGVGPCTGDSGGPLVNNDVLVGVISFGVLTCTSGVQPGPSVFTNVAFYRNWIRSITNI